MQKTQRTVLLTALTTLLGVSTLLPGAAAKDLNLQNVSYSYTKGFFNEYNPKFAEQWEAKHGDKITFEQSHAASGTQAKKVAAGELSADVVTLAAPVDIDLLHEEKGLLPADWATSYGNASSPYKTTIVLVVRKDNPKGITDWTDLTQPGLTILTSNPKICGGGRWNYLAAYGAELKRNGGDANKAVKFVEDLYENVPVCYKGVGLSAKAFLEGTGDVLITYENVILNTLADNPDAQVQIVVPSISVDVELPVAVVTANTDKHGTTEAAKAYLAGLYEPDAQRLFAKYNFRPANEKILAEVSSRFPEVKTFKVAEIFDNWTVAQDSQFAHKGVFDEIYRGKLLY